MAENNVIPEYADKLLFAEDLMNHAMMRHETKYRRMTAERYRTFVYNAFNETIEEAVIFLYQEVDKESENLFSNLFSQRPASLENYTKYVRNTIKKYDTSNFDAKGFLLYCVQLAGLAAAFHKHGIVEAPDSAIDYIVEAIYNVDMTTGRWDTLNKFAKSIANGKKNILKKLSPHSTSHEAASAPITSKSKRLNSGSEENIFPNKKS